MRPAHAQDATGTTKKLTDNDETMKNDSVAPTKQPFFFWSGTSFTCYPRAAGVSTAAAQAGIRGGMSGAEVVERIG